MLMARPEPETEPLPEVLEDTGFPQQNGQQNSSMHPPAAPYHMPSTRLPRRQAGLTLFELVVYILVVAILFSFAFNRFREYPGEAERANFMAVREQIKTGVNLAMLSAISGGDWSEVRAMEGGNPMDLMLETPSNYVGELSPVASDNLPSRVWYFDRASGELVYRANDAEDLYRLSDGERIPVDEIRLEITRVEDGEGGFEGLSLRPVTPYEWLSVDLSLPRQGDRPALL